MPIDELDLPEDLESKALFTKILQAQGLAGNRRAIVLLMMPITGAEPTKILCQSNMPQVWDVIQTLEIFIAEVKKNLPPLN